MKLKSYIAIVLLATIWQLSIAQTQKGNDIDGEATNDRSGSSVSMPDANTVAIGARQNSGNGVYSGQVRVFEWNGSGWIQKGADIDGEAEGDQSGFAVSMPDAVTVAIGAPFNDDTASGSDGGHVRIYQWNGSAWVQKGADINGEADGDQSGSSVSMPSINTVAIGAKYNNGNGASGTGHVRIYTWDGSNWIQKGSDIDGEAIGDHSGCAVSMPDDNTVAIGADGNDGNGSGSGHVRIYVWNGTAWIQKGSDIDGEAASDFSGCAVSMPDNNTVAIGAWSNDGNGADAGQIRVYDWSGSAWVQRGNDIDGTAATDNFGFSVSMPHANTVAGGAWGNDVIGADAGRSYVYIWDGNAWIQKGANLNGESAGDQSGWSISMPDTSTLAVGANRNSGNGSESGQVRIYSFPITSSVAENNVEAAIQYYPNPFTDEITIVFEDNTSASMIVRNITGQEVTRITITSQKMVELPIPSSAGLYFVEVVNGAQQTVLRVMKQ